MRERATRDVEGPDVAGSCKCQRPSIRRDTHVTELLPAKPWNRSCLPRAVQPRHWHASAARAAPFLIRQAAVIRDGEARDTPRVQLHPVEDHDGRTAHLETIGVEGDRPEARAHSIDDMARGRVARIVSSRNEFALNAGLQVQYIDRRRGDGPVSEEHRTAARKHLRESPKGKHRRRTGVSHRARCATGCRDGAQNPALQVGKDNRIARAPASPHEDRGVRGDRRDGPAMYRDFPERLVSRERDPLAIGREKEPVGQFGPAQHLTGEGVQRTYVDSPRSPREIRDVRAGRGECDIVGEGGLPEWSTRRRIHHKSRRLNRRGD